MAAAGVVANLQPQFVVTDAAWVELRLPRSLLDTSYPTASLLAAGIPIAGGSDSPVEAPAPENILGNVVY